MQTLPTAWDEPRGHAMNFAAVQCGHQAEPTTIYAQLLQSCRDIGRFRAFIGVKLFLHALHVSR